MWRSRDTVDTVSVAAPSPAAAAAAACVHARRLPAIIASMSFWKSMTKCR